jgi:hypothetical protein
MDAVKEEKFMNEIEQKLEVLGDLLELVILDQIEVRQRLVLLAGQLDDISTMLSSGAVGVEKLLRVAPVGEDPAVPAAEDEVIVVEP